MKVLIPAARYQCGECSDPLIFENTKLTEQQPWAIGWCENTDRFSNITGELLRPGCSRAGIKMRVEVQLIDCEVIK
jgi:hypothetical protein